MHITRFTDYSLRVLMYAATNSEVLSTIEGISSGYGISKDHLRKVVHDLTLKGYLKSIRGKNGGLRLARDPSEINLGQLVRETETDKVFVDCFNGGRGCTITPVCELKNVFTEALDGFFAVLDGYTLRDILPQTRQAELVKLLHIG